MNQDSDKKLKALKECLTSVEKGMQEINAGQFDQAASILDDLKSRYQQWANENNLPRKVS
jgi:hypothetical protein